MRAALQEALMSGPKTAAELQARLGISQPTLSRLLKAQHADIYRLGRARATRYAWRRRVQALSSSQPIYRVSRDGRIQLLGELHVLRGGYWFEDQESPAASQWFDGLPWFLTDMRPQGFLGQRFAHQLSDLGLPESLRASGSCKTLPQSCASCVGGGAASSA